LLYFEINRLAFIEFESISSAARAKEEMDGLSIDGRNISVVVTLIDDIVINILP
jgi:RNA recognition motif-containing protein